MPRANVEETRGPADHVLRPQGLMPSLDMLRRVANSAHESEVGAFLPQILPLLFQPQVFDGVVSDDSGQHRAANRSRFGLVFLHGGVDDLVEVAARVHR